MERERAPALPIVFWGASGHAKVLRAFLQRLGYTLVALFDNNPCQASPFSDIPIYHGAQGFQTWAREQPAPKIHYAIAIGGDRGRAREAIGQMLASYGLLPTTLIHPQARVEQGARIGSCCQVLIGAAVCADAVLGSYTIVNTNASVDHECSLGRGVHVAPGATLAGCVEIGDYAFIGAGSVVLPRVTIGADAIIGAGSVVTRNLPPNVVAYGSPARVVRARDVEHD